MLEATSKPGKPAHFLCFDSEKKEAILSVRGTSPKFCRVALHVCGFATCGFTPDPTIHDTHMHKVQHPGFLFAVLGTKTPADALTVPRRIFSRSAPKVKVLRAKDLAGNIEERDLEAGKLHSGTNLASSAGCESAEVCSLFLSGMPMPAS